MSKAEDILEKFKRSFNTPSTKDEKIKVVLVCIVISTTFWFFNALNKNDYVTRINYPVSFQYDEEAYVATEPLPTRIPVEVSGGGWDLMTRYFGFKMNAIEVKLETPDQSNYILAASLRPEIAPELEPITVNYFLQDSIRFKVERKVSSEVVLAYDTSDIAVSDNYVRTSEIRINPATVKLTGPSSRIEAIGDTLWLKERISGISEDFEDEVSLPDLPELVSASQNNVQVSFLVVRLFPVEISVPIELKNFPRGNWALTPPKAQVMYKVPETNFDVTDTTGIRLFVDYKQLAQDSGLVVQQEVLNKAFSQITVTPERVKAVKNE